MNATPDNTSTELHGLEGVWSYPSLTSPGHEEVMCIDEKRGRIITFAYIEMPGSSPKPHPIRNWYRLHSANAVELALRLNEEWTVHDFSFVNGDLVWFYGGRSHAWKRMARCEYPDWLEAKLAAAHAKMDADEQGA